MFIVTRTKLINNIACSIRKAEYESRNPIPTFIKSSLDLSSMQY